MRSKHVREHKASLPSATNRLHHVVAAPHHPLPGLHQPRHRPGHPHPTPTTSPACSGRQRCSSWTSTPTVSSSSSKSCRRECKHCSCHIATLCEHMQASACAEQRHVRWGGCVHEHAKKRRTRNAEDRRADRDAALAHRTPEQRGLPASARTQGNVSMCTSSSMPDKSVRMQAASGARLLGSWCAHATSAGRGIVAGLPALKKTPRMMESRPKAPWCEGDRPSRPSPHHGAASSRMELARASSRRLERPTDEEADAASPATRSLRAVFSDMTRVTPAHSTRTSVAGIGPLGVGVGGEAPTSRGRPPGHPGGEWGRGVRAGRAGKIVERLAARGGQRRSRTSSRLGGGERSAFWTKFVIIITL